MLDERTKAAALLCLGPGPRAAAARACGSPAASPRSPAPSCGSFWRFAGASADCTSESSTTPPPRPPAPAPPPRLPHPARKSRQPQRNDRARPQRPQPSTRSGGRRLCTVCQRQLGVDIGAVERREPHVLAAAPLRDDPRHDRGEGVRHGPVHRIEQDELGERVVVGGRQRGQNLTDVGAPAVPDDGRALEVEGLAPYLL